MTYRLVLRALGWVTALCTSLAALAQTPSAHTVPDTMAQRMLACTPCHGREGVATNQGFAPRIAGKPADYLYQQLRHFRDRTRSNAAMTGLLDTLSDDYLQDMARYFSALDLPYPAPQPPTASAALLQRGEQLIRKGDAGRDVPACVACHGAAMTGRLPATPGLLGLPRDYLVAQIGAWKTGLRSAGEHDCMAQVARRLSGDDILAVSHWLATQPVPASGHPAPASTQTTGLRCQADEPVAVPVSIREPEGLVARGAYLARLGNCQSCHTRPGGALYEGGRAIATPFGDVVAGNLTPDMATGIGSWSADDFWLALHEGRSRDGRLLYPAFPYPQFTRISRTDADALFAYLRSLPAVNQPNRAHALRFPYNTQAALAVWRVLFFTPQTHQDRSDRSPAWNRGAYLVQGLGHCAACHAPRNALGAVVAGEPLSGAWMPALDWYAPSLLPTGAVTPQVPATVSLLQTGMTLHGVAGGPMAEVVLGSTQYLTPDDAQAVATYLQALPAAPVADRAVERANSAVLARGAKLYERHCADCHGAQGQGAARAYPALAGGRAVTLAQPANAIQTVLHGGFAPATTGQARPYGMPPFGHVLSNREVADVLSYVRQAWGNRAAEVTELEVLRARGGGG
jgi:mono/diheme cytochrome c family protein